MDAKPSERERMLRGELYNSRDPELLELAHRARARITQFAAIPSIDTVGHHQALKGLLGSVGDGVWIEPPFFCDYGQHIHIGANSFVNVNCVFLDSAEIRIGTDVLIGPGVQLLTVSHPVRAADRIVPLDGRRADVAPYRTHALPITVGDNVWIGAGTIVCAGVTIGENTTIGAGSIVTADVPTNTLAFGQPCRVARYFLMPPERYRNLNGDSGVEYYAIGPDFIAVQFKDSTVYIYNDSVPGRAHVDRMKELAVGGRGLGTYISQHVRKAFAFKQPAWEP